MRFVVGLIIVSFIFSAGLVSAAFGASEMQMTYNIEDRELMYAIPGINPDAVITEKIDKSPGKWMHNVKISQDDSPTSHFKFTQIRQSLTELGERTDRFEYRFHQMKYGDEFGLHLYDFSYVVKFTDDLKITQRFKVNGQTKLFFKYNPVTDETSIFHDVEGDGTHDQVFYQTWKGYHSIKLNTSNGFVLATIDSSV
ncbi:MAG: hypothetical protein AABX02_05420 [archaeon]